jgi:hypothetical protein
MIRETGGQTDFIRVYFPVKRSTYAAAAIIFFILQRLFVQGLVGSVK